MALDSYSELRKLYWNVWVAWTPIMLGVAGLVASFGYMFELVSDSALVFTCALGSIILICAGVVFRGYVQENYA